MRAPPPPPPLVSLRAALQSGSLRVAVGQLSATGQGDIDGNVATIVKMIAAAASEGARVIVFPEECVRPCAPQPSDFIRTPPSPEQNVTTTASRAAGVILSFACDWLASATHIIAAS
jgi:predicted amidohydrolase